MRITVSSLWDGSPLPVHKQVVLTLEVVEGGSSLSITVDSPYYGDPSPTTPNPRSCEELWEFEVVELFIKGRADRYIEIEMGPHGHCLILTFNGYRDCSQRGLLPISYEAKISQLRWTGTMLLPLSLLPPSPDVYNAFAIHNKSSGGREYCIAFPPGDSGCTPDFHTLELFREFPEDLFFH